MNASSSRRLFLKKTLLSTSILPFAAYCTPALAVKTAMDYPPIYIFSKHLQFLNYEDMADAAAEIGFAGVELTVRPKGHVLPENAAVDLPKAIAAIQKSGLKSDMIVTAITDIVDENTKPVLQTAADLGVKYYRMGYYKYAPKGDLLSDFSTFQTKFNALADFNKSLGIKGIYQNHAGHKQAGASIWELWQLMEKTTNETMGCQFDIRHAMVEGGLAWPKNLRLIQSRIQAIVAKDYLWAQKDGKWKVKNVPIGEGMVDFVSYFKMLKTFDIQVPLSLHLEYPIAGAEHGATKLDKASQETVFTAMKKDLKKVKELWEMA